MQAGKTEYDLHGSRKIIRILIKTDKKIVRFSSDQKKQKYHE